MWLGRLVVLVSISWTATLSAATLPPVEPMPTLDAATLAPEALLKGGDYTVDATVPVVGYMGQFTLRAPAGTFSADGTEMLAIRIRDLAAIAQLSQLSRTGVFASALGTSAVNTGAAVGRAVMDPVGTVAGIPAGVGRLFRSVGTTMSRATESSVHTEASQGTDEGDSVTTRRGVDRATRQLARQVGADPYTTNPVLARQLDSLARAAFMGGVSLDVALFVSTAGAATAVSATSTISNLVWDKSPEDIRTLHENQLATMGVSARTIRAFVTNRWFTPTLSVPFVEGLLHLPPMKGREAVVALASSAASEVEARFLVNAVGMAGRIGTESDPVTALELDGRILVVHMRSGRVEVPAPVDYLVWTEPVKAFAAHQGLKGEQRKVRVTGLASARVHEGLQATGWGLLERTGR
jgi:hypothetical protein